ncbi:MAG: MATE family efflux transporter [Lentisphaerae bacterium]|nr:MATE family efflux transporter [Lentisphaerota bacterium]
MQNSTVSGLDKVDTNSRLPEYRELLRVALPLIMAASGHALRLFSDRIMLSHYSPEALAASMPAGLFCFTFMSIFIGTAGYANTFVSQYTGAGQHKKTGALIWQALHISLLGGAIVALFSLVSVPIFRWVGHASAVQEQQVEYFNVLAWFSFSGIALAAVNSFWSGRGETKVVMMIELMCAAVNVILNTLLIFGKFGLPRLGIFGAGLATGLSNTLGLALALVLFLSKANREKYETLPRRILNSRLMWRLLKYGFPNGLQFALDLMAFNFFVVLIGRQGQVQLEASNIAFAINALVYLPILGLGMTASIFVGQWLGADNVPMARASVRRVMILSLFYNVSLGSVLLWFPEQIVGMFLPSHNPARGLVLVSAVRCLRYVVAYLVFDSFYMVQSQAIKGAGDTRFAMCAGISLSWATLAIPCYYAIKYGGSIWTLWTILVVHVMIVSVVFSLRYLMGPWTTMRVIDHAPPAPETDYEIDLGR